MAALAFYAMFPAVYNSRLRSEQETKAIQISSRLIENLQLLKPANLTAATLSQLNLVDAGQAASPYSFSNIPMDDASIYSPSKVLPQGTGTLTTTTLGNGSILCKITITWGGKGGTKSYTTGTVVGGYR